MYNNPYSLIKNKDQTVRKITLNKNQILKWEALKKNGDAIDVHDVIDEFVFRLKLNSIQDIIQQIWNVWNGKAIQTGQKLANEFKERNRVTCNLFSQTFICRLIFVYELKYSSLLFLR